VREKEDLPFSQSSTARAKSTDFELSIRDQPVVFGSALGQVGFPC
jgi:hypothetical protein